MPKILIATPLYPPDIGGPATYVKFIENNLYPSKQDCQLDILKFGDVRHLPYGIRHIVYFFKVLFRGRDADIVYALDALGVGIPAGIAAKLLRKRFFVRIAGDRAWETATQKFGISESLDTFSSSTKYSFPVRTLKAGQVLGANLAEKIIVPSEYLKKIVSNWGVSAEKITVIYNAFDPTHVDEKKDALRQQLSLQGTVLLSAGRFVPWKGFEALMQIMPRIIDRIPDAVLYIAGDGPQKEKLFNLSSELRQKGKIIFLGTMPKEELFQYIKAADIFLLNTFYEGFSHQLLETMSLGTPVIATTVGGNPELIENEKEGLLVKYDDKQAFLNAVLRLREEEGLSEKLSVSAMKKVERFSSQRAISAFVKAFDL